MELLQGCALVHDDVMDASAVRRGGPAVHADFARMHREELSRLPGVTQMESGFVLREVVAPRLPLTLLE